MQINQFPVLRTRERHLFFSLKDNRTVILNRQDFLPERTADGDLLFTFLSNILDFRRSFLSYLKFDSRHEDSSPFVASRAASHPKISFRSL